MFPFCQLGFNRSKRLQSSKQRRRRGIEVHGTLAWEVTMKSNVNVHPNNDNSVKSTARREAKAHLSILLWYAVHCCHDPSSCTNRRERRESGREAEFALPAISVPSLIPPTTRGTSGHTSSATSFRGYRPYIAIVHSSVLSKTIPRWCLLPMKF